MRASRLLRMRPARSQINDSARLALVKKGLPAPVRGAGFLVSGRRTFVTQPGLGAHAQKKDAA